MTKASDPLQIRKRLSRLNRKRKANRPAPGAAPGALTASPNATATRVRYSRFGDGDAVEHSISSVAEIPPVPADGKGISWIDVQGFADIGLIEEIGQHFHLHPLVIADLVHTGQRPKSEIHDDYIVTILRQPRGGPPFDCEQTAIVWCNSFVLTCQERHGDIFDPVRNRMRKGTRLLADIGAGYFAYTLLDTIIDGYFPILEAYGELIEDLEQQVMERPNPRLIADIHVLKRELLDMRRAIWSQREAVNILLRDETALISEALKIYLRDCADHCFQLLDMVEVYREVAQGLIELHLSSVSNRMNEIMKVLTVISTIFIPMTFIAGLYGMNFDRKFPFNMPELGWRFGYGFALCLMAMSAGAMLVYFWRKSWIGDGPKKTPPFGEKPDAPGARSP